MMEGFADLEGGRLYYQIDGTGPEVVLVNPGALDCRIWDPQWEHLTRSHRVLRYDPRGFRRSSPPEGPFSHLRDLRALLDVAGIPRAHLIGSSFGGSLALDFGAAHPDRVISMVLVGAGGPQNGFPVPEELARAFAPIAQAMREDFRRGIDVWLDQDTRMPRDPALIRLVRDLALDNETYWKTPPTWSEPLRPPVSERLKEISAPALLVVGERDHPYTHEVAKKIAEGMTDARFVVMPGAGHLAHLEKPREFHDLIDSYLSSTVRSLDKSVRAR